MNTLIIYSQITYVDLKKVMLRHNIGYFIFVLVIIGALIGNYLFHFVSIEGNYKYIVVGFVIYLILKPLYRLWRLKRTAMSNDFLSPSEFRFTSESLVIQFATSKQECHLSDIRYAVETKDLFVLYLGRASTHIIPKRCITTNSDLLELRRILQQSVKKTKIKTTGY